MKRGLVGSRHLIEKNLYLRVERLHGNLLVVMES